jgi:hypothetical protein
MDAEQNVFLGTVWIIIEVTSSAKRYSTSTVHEHARTSFRIGRLLLDDTYTPRLPTLDFWGYVPGTGRIRTGRHQHGQNIFLTLNRSLFRRPPLQNNKHRSFSFSLSLRRLLQDDKGMCRVFRAWKHCPQSSTIDNRMLS